MTKLMLKDYDILLAHLVLLFPNTNCREYSVRFSGIRTLIVGRETEHTDRLTTLHWPTY